MVLINTFTAFSVYLTVKYLYVQAYDYNYSLTTVAAVTTDIATRYHIHSIYLLHSSYIKGKFREIQSNICSHVIKYKGLVTMNTYKKKCHFKINHFHAMNEICRSENDLIPCTRLGHVLDVLDEFLKTFLSI